MTRGRLRLVYLLLAALAAFVLLAIAVGDARGWVVDTDQDVADSVHDIVEDDEIAVDVSKAVTFFGSSAALYPLSAVVVVFALTKQRPALAVFVIAVVVLGALLNSVVKEIVDRRRPEFSDPIAVGGGMSFPSGHAMNSLIVFGAATLVVWLLCRQWARVATTVAVSAVVAIGVTRITLGVHFPSDVVGGWLLGLSWLAVCALAASFVPGLSVEGRSSESRGPASAPSARP